MRLLPLAFVAVTLAAEAFGQGYTLRPGTRGFDPRLNRYGVTEEAPPPVASLRSDPSKTLMTIDVLTTGNGGGLDAQRWSQKLADLGYPARIRRAEGPDDKPGVAEKTRGPLRLVTVVGALDRSGDLVFPGRIFSIDRAADLKEWLDELKIYGAQGSPEGRPLWGLSRSQFEAVYASLARPATAEVAGRPLAGAVAALPLPESYPLRFSAEAKRRLDGPDAPAAGATHGLTTGTALAYLLSGAELGFRPNRTPEGTIELLVEPLRPAVGDGPPLVWPVGWDIEETAAPTGEKVRDNDPLPPPNRAQLAPGLFDMTAIELRNVPLAEALAAAGAAAGVPVLLDRSGLAAAGVDPVKVRVTHPPRRTSWNIALRSVTVPNRLRHEVRRDEAGKPLVWVTPLGRAR